VIFLRKKSLVSPLFVWHYAIRRTKEEPMSEHVLLLMQASDFAEHVANQLMTYGVDSLTRAATQDELEQKLVDYERFDVIIITDTFCGNGRDTAALVKKIRTKFFKPMIVYAVFGTNEGPFACQVAGCNFVVYGNSTKRSVYELLFQVGKIGEELEREHQKD